MLHQLLKRKQETRWPKPRVVLTEAERSALERWYQDWMPNFHQTFSVVHRFNHHFVASLPLPAAREGRLRTLEIGGGSGDHVRLEDLSKQDYYAVELRPEFLETLAGLIGKDHCVLGDVQDGVPWPDAYFDRVIAIHVLEHLHDLPLALKEIERVLKPGGVFDIVLPCEAGALYWFARQISSKRMFEKEFDVSYERIIKSDHVNTYAEVEAELERRFDVRVKRFFPFAVPSVHANICVGLRVVRS